MSLEVSTAALSGKDDPFTWFHVWVNMLLHGFLVSSVRENTGHRLSIDVLKLNPNCIRHFPSFFQTHSNVRCNCRGGVLSFFRAGLEDLADLCKILFASVFHYVWAQVDERKTPIALYDDREWNEMAMLRDLLQGKFASQVENRSHLIARSHTLPPNLAIHTTGARSECHPAGLGNRATEG